MGTEWGPPPGSTAQHGDELARHLQAGSLDAARRTADELLAADGQDEALALLA